MSAGIIYHNAIVFHSYKCSLVLLFITLLTSNAIPLLESPQRVEGTSVPRFRLGVSIPSSVVRGFGKKHGISIDLNYEGGRKFYDYMTKGPGFFSYIDFAMGLYDFWAGPGEREFLKGMLDRADEEGAKCEISIKLYGLDLGWSGWEPYLYLLLEAIGPSRPSMRYIFLAGEWSYKNKVPPGWDDLYADFQRAKQIVNNYGYDLGWGGEGKYLTNIPFEYRDDFYALGPRKRACQVSRDPDCQAGAQKCYIGANWWERPNDVFLEAFTMWDREANIPNTPPYYICYEKFKEFIHGAVDRFDASGGAYPQAVVFEIMPETFNDIEGVECPYLAWWREFAETYNLMIFDNAVKVRDSPGLQPPSPFPPYPCGLKYQNYVENLPPFCVVPGDSFKGSIATRNEYTREPLRNKELEIYLIKCTSSAGRAPWNPLPITKEEWNNMVLVGRVTTGSDGWAKGFSLPAPIEPGFYTVVARVPSSGQEMEAFSDVIEGIWVAEKVHKVKVETNIKVKLSFGPSAYGPPWTGFSCEAERWVEPNKPLIGDCAEGEWKFILPSEVTDQGKTWIFSHWEDGSTNPTRTILVDRDLVIEAFYSEQSMRTKFTVQGCVRDDRNYSLPGAFVTVSSSIDRITTITDSQGEYEIVVSVNGPGDIIGIIATYNGRSGSACGNVPYEISGMQIDVVVPRASTSISCSVSPSTIRIGEKLTVSGIVSSAVEGSTVTLNYIKPDASSFTHTVITSSNGAYSVNYIPDQPGSYTVVASWPGNEDYKGATSLPVLFTVKKNPSLISLNLDNASIAPGSALRISGDLSPDLSNAKVILSYRIKGGGWVGLKNLSTDSGGKFSYVWMNTPSVEGEYELMASWPGNDYYEGSSCSLSFIILRIANPPAEPNYPLTFEEPQVSATYEPSQKATLILPTLNFTVSSNPKIIMVPRISGYNTTVTIKVSSLSNYTIEPSLEVSGIPEGIEARLSCETLSIRGFGSNFTSLIIRIDANPPEQGNYSILVECGYEGVVIKELLTLLIIDRLPAILRVDTTSSSVQYGDTFLISGSVSPQHQARIAIIAILKNGTEISMATFNTDETGVFSQNIRILLVPNEYIVRVLCEGDNFCLGSVLNLTLRVKRASIIITLGSNTVRAGSNELVFLNGTVVTTKGERVRKMDLTILISGETGTISIPAKTDENGVYTAVISTLSVGKYEAISIIDGNDYYEPARSAPVKIEVLHPVSRILNDILYPILSTALVLLILITSIRVIVLSVHEIKEERSYGTNRTRGRK